MYLCAHVRDGRSRMDEVIRRDTVRDNGSLTGAGEDYLPSLQLFPGPLCRPPRPEPPPEPGVSVINAHQFESKDPVTRTKPSKNHLFQRLYGGEILRPPVQQSFVRLLVFLHTSLLFLLLLLLVVLIGLWRDGLVILRVWPSYADAASFVFVLLNVWKYKYSPCPLLQQHQMSLMGGGGTTKQHSN